MSAVPLRSQPKSSPFCGSYRRATFDRRQRTIVPKPGLVRLRRRRYADLIFGKHSLAVALAFNAATPFITPDPPWLSDVPVVLAIMMLLIIIGLLHRIQSEPREGE